MDHTPELEKFETKYNEWESPFQPGTLVEGLRCPVCLDYFTQPHTLACGHSFCLRCLRTLAKITRSSRVHAPLDRLRLRCPSCRKMTPARPILRRRASVNYVLKELVNDWFESPYASGTIEHITLRSISSQTEDGSSGNVGKASLNLKSRKSKRTEPAADDSESETDDISRAGYRRILFHRLDSKTDNVDIFKVDDSPDTDTAQTTTADESAASDDNVATSSSEDDSEQEIGPLFEDLQVVDAIPNRRRLQMFELLSMSTVLRLFYTECCLLLRGILASRSRLALTLFWFIYGGLVVCISRGFFPWMAIYTVIYFVIMYADIAHPEHF